MAKYAPRSRSVGRPAITAAIPAATPPAAAAAGNGQAACTIRIAVV